MLAFIVLLRAAATILVINSHCDTIWPISALATGGSLGDSLFFSVSGFCLYKIKGKFLPWFIKRAIRIYPSVVVATVIISLFNGRSIFDNFFKLYIFPTGYSFIGALIIFYIVYYPIVKLSWKFEHIFSVLLSISALAYLVVYLKYTNISGWSIEGGWIKKVYWFQMFLLGGYIRLKYEEISQRLKRIKVLQLCGCCTVLFFIFYSLKAILVKYSKLQYQISIHIVEILFLLALLLLVIKLEPRLKQLQYKLIWKPIRFLSIITLENYLLMDVIIERCDSIVFPISVIIAFGGTFACAYLLHLFTDIPYKIVKKNGREMDISKWYRLERKLYLKHIPLVPKIIKGLIRILWGGVIPYQADIGEGTQFTYQGLGVVIHKHSVIGKNCMIRQHVTIGGGGGPEGLPVIGDNVDIGAGAVIVGGVHIGNNVKIGANAFVNKDLPDNCIAVGIPAQPVKFK